MGVLSGGGSANAEGIVCWLVDDRSWVEADFSFRVGWARQREVMSPGDGRGEERRGEERHWIRTTYQQSTIENQRSEDLEDEVEREREREGQRQICHVKVLSFEFDRAVWVSPDSSVLK